MIASSRQKLCYGYRELLRVLVIPWTGLWWAKWSLNFCLLLSLTPWHSGSISNTLICRPQCSFISSVYTKKKILANKCLNQMKFFVSLFVYIFFFVSMFVYKRWMYLKMTTGLKIIPSVYIYLCQQVCSQNVVLWVRERCKVWQDGICLLNINDFLKRLSL